MSDGPALLAAILAHPAEDTPRLVYADYLDELGTVSVPWDCKRLCGVRHDDRCGLIGGTGFVPDTSNRERAEFIRLQIAKTQWGVCPNGPQLHRSPAVCPECQRRGAAARRERELLNAHGYAWLCPALTALESEWHGRACEYRRGFVESVTCTAADFMRHADAIFRAHPVSSVRLSDRIPHHYGDVYNWLPEERDGFNTSGAGYIPGVLVDEMVRGGWYTFDHVQGTSNLRTEEAAYAALSAGCVALGRRRAGVLVVSPRLRDAMAVAGLEESAPVTLVAWENMIAGIIQTPESAPASSDN